MNEILDLLLENTDKVSVIITLLLLAIIRFTKKETLYKTGIPVVKIIANFITNFVYKFIPLKYKFIITEGVFLSVLFCISEWSKLTIEIVEKNLNLQNDKINKGEK